MYLILGYGRTGQSVERYLQSINKNFLVYDEEKKITPIINWNIIECVVQSPGISFENIVSKTAIDKNIRICTDINLLQQRNPKANYIGITGTNGKSTTTALIGYVLKNLEIKTEIGGNIGIPVLDLKDLSESEWYVLELSSYQLELSEPLNLNLSVWLNISFDHLERHKTMLNYVNSKKRIFLNSKSAVVGTDDDFSKQIVNELKIPFKAFSTASANEKFYVDSSGKIYIQDNVFDFNECKLKGSHNWQNMAAAFLTVMKIESDLKKIFEIIKTFPGLQHRQQNVGLLENVLFINDSKATNADSTEKALSTYKNYNVFWILGGKAKTDGIDSLCGYFSKIKKAYLIGESQERFAKTLDNRIVFEKCNTLDIAVKKAFHDAKSIDNSVVLFSPACASFDQFKDFEHRGEEFQRLVKDLS